MHQVYHIAVRHRAMDKLFTALLLFEVEKVVGYSIRMSEKKDEPTAICLHDYAPPASHMGGESKDPTRDAFVPFPFKMTIRQAADFVIAWLEEQVYPRTGGGDGSYEKGWFLVGRDHDYKTPYGVFVVIRPSWIYYSK